MDGTGAIPGSLRSITAAATVANEGDKILVKGMEQGGQYYPYSDRSPGYLGSDSETFPITLQPGVTIEAYDATPVIVASVQSPDKVLVALDSSVTSAQATRIRDLNLVGGAIALKLDRSTGDNLAVEVEDLVFVKNTMGLSAYLSGGTQMSLAIRSPRFSDDASSLAGLPDPPMLAGQTQGIFLRAQDTGGTPAKLTVTLDDLRTQGSFTTMDPQTPEAAWSDLLERIPGGSGAVTRLVEILVQGENLEYTGGPSQQPISEVKLTVTGGNWHGRASASGGWDLGLLAYAEGVGQNLTQPDFGAGFDVRVIGTTVRAFRQAGLHPAVQKYARGRLEISSQAEVRDTGPQAQHLPGDTSYSGVHCWASKGYLALTGVGAKVTGNTGDGVLLRCSGSFQIGGFVVPSGLYIEVEDWEVHQNQGNGFHFIAGEGTREGDLSQGAVVGGTWDEAGGSLSLYRDGTEPVSFTEHGQGVVNACAVSNNGEAGFRFRIVGHHSSLGVGGGWRAAANVRLVNNIVWNNPAGGVYAVLEPPPAYQEGPFFLVPLVHDTLAGNGSAQAPWSIEISELAAAQGDTFYQFQDPSGQDLRCLLANTIFQRKVFTDQVFGPYLMTLQAPDVSGGISSATRIGVAGVRVNFVNSYDVSTTSVTPFVTSPIWGSLDRTQFKLDGLGTTFPDFDGTPQYINAQVPEAAFDFEGDPRPPQNQADWDKGADQYVP